MIFISVCVVITAVILYIGYTYSLYSSAAYIEPEKIENILSRLKGFRRKYALEIEANPKISLQLAVIFKSFLLILLSVLAVFTVNELMSLYKFIPMFFIWNISK